GPGGLGVDIENNFKPKYTLIAGKKKIINELKKAVKNAEKVYLATDPDREGEAISWHLYDTLDLVKEDNLKVYRVVFNEITKKAIINAINNPRSINMDLVKSQESRRILDRIIGFKLSKLLQSKIKSKSAGRVQSVALKLVVDREKEIENFKVEEYYTIDAVFTKDNINFDSTLYAYNSENIEINTLQEAEKILQALNKDYIVRSIEKKEKAKNPKPPFITSTLQQEASSKLNFNARKTMNLAQKLYEGIEIDGNPIGLITYMRTDSVRYADEFVKDTKDYIKSHYGDNYVNVNQKFKVNKNAQDAHEAIRPTDILRTPESIKKYLTPDLYKLYKLIYIRALASLMAPAKLNQTNIIIENNNYQFKVNGQELIFDGYLKVYSAYEDTKDNVLPTLYPNELVELVEIKANQHFTQPPSRYTEAKLIKEMEELGIGRPSTYALTMETLKSRNYVTVIDNKFHPTPQGIVTSEKLAEYFSNIINVNYTREMESSLDDIAHGEKVWYEELKQFYDYFIPMVEFANNHMEKLPPKYIDEYCPECGKQLIIRQGRYGEFIGCSGYPECKYIKKIEKAKNDLIELDIQCPLCKEGHFVERITKKGRLKGKKFYACSNYPKCKNIVVNMPIAETCPECGNILTINGDKIICGNKKCGYTKEK
ncbi:MAG TPA: type I DNA topoisomerase, partial [Haloplasmataceae bacterium]